MSIQEIISNSVNEFHKILSHLKEEFARLQVGRASSALVENVPVDMYGSTQYLKGIASISIPDSRTIQIQPWDRGSLGLIEKAIVGVGTGLNPVNDGICIRIAIPPLTEERRFDLTKHVKALAEDARISIRNLRQDAHNDFKKLKTGGEITEDDSYDAIKRLQDKVEEINKDIDEAVLAKEQDVMTV